MAYGDMRVVSGGYGTLEVQTDDRDTSGDFAIVGGEPVKRSNTNFGGHLLDGDPEPGTDILFGIATSNSTETATADGKVNVEMCGPGTRIEARPRTAANIDTASELITLKFDYVKGDVLN